MITPINSRDLALQATDPRVLGTITSYVTLVVSDQEVEYGADNLPVPPIVTVTALLNGVLKGVVAFQISGLLPDTPLVTDVNNSNKLILDPSTFASEKITVTAILTFAGETYTSLPVNIYKKYVGIATRITRAFDSLQANANGNGYTLPTVPNYLELYNGNIKFTEGLVFGPSTVQTKNGLSALIDTETGEITLGQIYENDWISDYENFVFTVTYNNITYPVTYTITKVRQSDYTPDLTPPPTPTGVNILATATHIVVAHDDPTYTVGHGHSKTKVYGIIVNTGDPDPTITTPGVTLLGEFSGFVGKIPADIGVNWHLWVYWTSVDGVDSITPSGGTNGHTISTDKINGQYQIEPLSVVEANIGYASISSAKIANTIESTNYDPGITGWAISRETGNAEFNNITARGNITANHLSAATGTFSGELLAAGGRFTGTIQAGAIDISALIGTSVIYSTAGSFDIPVPTDITVMKVTLLGAGGGGQSGWGAIAGLGGAGAGGEAGSMQSATFNVSQGQTYTVDLGLGGNPGSGYYGAPNGTTANGPSGSPGAASQLRLGNTVLLTALGGKGGAKWLDQGIFGSALGYNPGLGDSAVHYGYQGEPTEFAAGGTYNTSGTKASGGGGGNANNDIDTQTLGTKGGDGYVLVEFYNPNALIGRDEFDALVAYIGLSETQPTENTPPIFSGSVTSTSADPHYSYAYWPGTTYNMKGSLRKYIKEDFTITEMMAWSSSPVPSNTKVSLKVNGEFVANVTIPAGYTVGTELSQTTATITEYGDPYYYYVRFLCKFEGNDQGTAFNESQSHAITRGGSVITTSAKYKFGLTSAYFPPAASSYLYMADSADFEFGGGDFCIDGWLYLTEKPAAGPQNHYGILNKRNNISSLNSWTFGLNSYTGKLTFAYTTSGTATADPFSAPDTKLLMHFDGPNAGTSFTDSALNTRTWTNSGTPTTSTVVSPVFGTSSLLLNSTSQISTNSTLSDFTFGTGDFTIETWFYSTSITSAIGYLLRLYGTYTTGLRWGNASEGDKLLFNMRDGTTANMYSINKTRATLLNSWNHIAIVRQSGVLKVYLNGVQENLTQLSTGTSQSSWTDTTSVSATSGLVIGSSSNSFIGNVDEMRISNIAIYTAPFTVPVNAFYMTAAAGSYTKAVEAAGDVPLNTWFHFAVVRNGNTLAIYQNGMRGATLNVGTDTIYDGATSLVIGALDSYSYNFYRGYMDSIRITKGAARYTTEVFDIPTTEFASKTENTYGYTDTGIVNLAKAVAADSYITLDLASAGASDIGFRFKFVY